MAPLPPNPLNLGGAPPSDLAPKGKLALPPNPIAAALVSAPKVAPPKSLQAQRNQQNTDFLAGVQQRKEQLQAHPVHGTLGGLAHAVQQGIKNTTGVNLHGLSHPLASLEGKGEFAAPTRTFDGKEVPFYAQPLPWFGGSSVLGGAAKAGRTAEEAQQHLLEAAATAKAQGHAFVPHVVEKGVATPETGGEVGRQIRESFTNAPEVRKAQKAGYSVERAQRVRAASQADIQAGGGVAGHLAGKAKLASALPKEHFGDLMHLTPEQVHQAVEHINQSPLQYFDRVHAKDALLNAVHNGIVPTEGDQALLEHAFGRVAGATAESQAKLASFWDKFVSYTNIPRALRSSADVSAALRQGLVVLVTHPKVWGRQFAKSLKSFGSENFYQAEQATRQSDPFYPLAVKWKVPFTEIGGKVANNEEAFIGGQAAEHLHELPGIKGTPVATLLRPASNVIRRSDRAFTGFQNGTRFEMAKMLAEKAALLGHDLNDQQLGESIGRVVGTFTGRGVTPKILAGHLTTMNALMFSPRLMAARLNLLSPVYYAKLDPFARAEAIRGARNLVASIGTVMFIAKMLGADVNFDPRSSNFTKIKIGNTRIDIAGGFSQYVRFIAQEMTREAISSSGHKSHIGWGQHDISDLANLTKLGRSKSAPIPGFLWDEASGKDFVGRPISQSHELWSNAPFVAQDTVDAKQLSGTKAAVIDGFLSAIGLGVQSYKDKQPKVTGGGSNDGFGDTGSFGDSGSFGSDTGFGG